MKLASAPVAARSTPLRARIHGTSIIHDGKLLVSNSRDLECDAARALLAKGITGKLHLFDNGGFKVAKVREHWGIRYVYTPRPLLPIAVPAGCWTVCPSGMKGASRTALLQIVLHWSGVRTAEGRPADIVFCWAVA